MGTTTRKASWAKCLAGTVVALAFAVALACAPASAFAEDDALIAASSAELTAQSVIVDLNAGASLFDYYKPVLDSAKAGSTYAVFDVDGNGVPELLVMDNTGMVGQDDMHVYTVDSNGLRSCGSTQDVAAYAVCGSKDGTLYLNRAHMGAFYTWSVSLVNGQVTTQVAFSSTHGGMSVDDFNANAAEASAFTQEHGIVGLETNAITDMSVLSRYAVVEKGSLNDITIWRCYNPNSYEHFYTPNSNERNNIVAAGWTFERMGWVAPTTSSTPVYRVYNPNNGGDHHYTKDAAEYQNLIRAGWLDEGISWYSDDAQAWPVYREYNPNEVARNHNYTTSPAEHLYLYNLGWTDEGIAFYALRAPAMSAEDEEALARMADNGWYTTTLYLYSRNGKPIPEAAQAAYSAIAFSGDTMQITGALYKGDSKEAVSRATRANRVPTNYNEFKVAQRCTFLVSPAIGDWSRQPHATDYLGFQREMYNGAMDLYDSVITFRVANGKVVEVYQTTRGNG